jgi:SAM-dependent methyltransferase
MSPYESISSTHNESIISQFTKQAIPYRKRHNVSNENELKQLVELTKANRNDIVLDLACGPGIVSCAFAKIVNHVTGIDLTPAMIDQAKILQKEKGLTNITWKIGDITNVFFSFYFVGISSCLFMSLSLGYAYAQTEIGSVSSNNHNTFSLYKNAQYNFDMQYPSNWQ